MRILFAGFRRMRLKTIVFSVTLLAALITTFCIVTQYSGGQSDALETARTHYNGAISYVGEKLASYGDSAGSDANKEGDTAVKDETTPEGSGKENVQLEESNMGQHSNSTTGDAKVDEALIHYQESQLTSSEDEIKKLEDSEIEQTSMPFEDDNLINKLERPLYAISGAEAANASNALLLENTEIYKKLLDEPITEPKVGGLIRENDPVAGKGNATIMALVQNKDVDAIVGTIQQLEEKFNAKFAYPYTLMNEEYFTDEFKNRITSMLPVDRVVHFAKIDSEDWDVPEDIDMKKYKENMNQLDRDSVQYAKKISYHNMCRFYSSKFYHQDVLNNYKYVWRIEPNVNFYCDIDYDIFQFMEENQKIYGFTLSLYDSPQSVRSLWNVTLGFVKENPHYLNRNGAFEWIKENLQKPENFNMTDGYSTCHFWTNFEIVDLDFLRSEPYEKYMDHLEKQGGFYYERWGDAPVRSLALALFADKSQIHWFRDVAYHHFPYTNCPSSPMGSRRCDGKCTPGVFSAYDNLIVENCLPTWIKYSMSEEQLDMY
ncbi:putative mannosyltransferase KNAG_0A03710 [Huiozyma naganishii CBS 8797]|uniref:Glycosyltransferase family 15 protein n=1 Tax=Huiozyma naganishii (strain ATCC MYA-139 / BCRC 22969 / CBS 8797 / KCTC 17520 / NBRC 10181 / NCYC 3082 / Yp74L-3) TaxID=1071383 RepID=J7S3L8_HUIN7|nr:hypothetical protein KNAG_0A03710 [Kazachstania naganishii CBS 8797]CCK68051.1 hypothetical protein KNAG_0A03710 [Kazachstania naganishii CBS 8797]